MLARCPNCRNTFSTDRSGRQECPACGKPLVVPEQAAAPSAPGEVGPGEGTPWERRDRIGLVSALVETTQQVLARPTEFFRAMPVTGGLGGPLFYAVILGYAGLVASALYGAVFQAVAGSRLLEMPHRGELAKLLPHRSLGSGDLYGDHRPTDLRLGAEDAKPG